MESNKFDISKLSDIELKALAYDEITKIEAAQGNLRIINEELTKRIKVPNNILRKFSNIDTPSI